MREQRRNGFNRKAVFGMLTDAASWLRDGFISDYDAFRDFWSGRQRGVL